MTSQSGSVEDSFQGEKLTINENILTFSDLFEEIKINIFKYLTLNERIKCKYVSREWWTLLSALFALQETVAIGEPRLDSVDQMKLGLCYINSCHTVTQFNTTTNELSELTRNNAAKETNSEDEAKVVSQLLKSFKSLRSVFIYTPVGIKLSDLPDTIEHIHFGHDVNSAIAFDKINFPRLTCVSTIDAHLGSNYMDGIINLLQANKLQLENVSVCEVSRSLCEQTIEMSHLKQLFVYGFQGLRRMYKEMGVEVMDAHPELQYFNIFRQPRSEDVEWFLELGPGTDRSLDRQFVIEAIDARPFADRLEFVKNYVLGLSLVLTRYDALTQYRTELNYLKYLRLTYTHDTFGSTFMIEQDTLRQSLEHHLNMAPNLQKLQLRFHADGFFDKEPWVAIVFSVVCAFAEKHSSRTISFELSAPSAQYFHHAHEPVPHGVHRPTYPKNLKVAIKFLYLYRGGFCGVSGM